MQRRHLDQRQGGVDDALQRPQNVLQLRVLHLITAQARHHEMVIRNPFRRRRGDLLGGLGGLLVLFLFPALLLLLPAVGPPL